MEQIILSRWPLLLLMFFLLCLSAFFSSAETAFFSLTSYDLEEKSAKKNPLRKLIHRLLSQPHKLLVTILFCNMLVNLLFFGLSFSLELPVRDQYGGRAVLLMALAIPLIVIVFGEVTPKALALTIPKQIAYLAAVPLAFIQSVFWPILGLLEKLSQFLLSFFRTPNPFPSVDELKTLLDSSGKKKLLGSREIRLIREVLDLDSIEAKEVMIPRVKAISLDLNNFIPSDFYQLIRTHRHTYYPAYEGSIDTMLGVINGQKFLLASKEDQKNISLFIEELPFVPECSTLTYTLGFLQKEQASMAVVVDEYGGFAGILFVEDMIEEIFGEFFDEFDGPSPPPIQSKGLHRYLVAGEVTLRELGEAMGVEVDNPKVSTVNGLMVFLAGGFPEKGYRGQYEKLQLTVVKAEKHMVQEVLVEFKPGEAP